MKIKELIIEGFKSYQKKVVLTEFDEQFNCLTGQNGTGKSNILEAIFFVIGANFKNQKFSRINNNLDLIYKRGQSGVQKAKVIIKFCNRDKEKSPVEYANLDDIVLERTISSIDNKSKFRLNSSTIKPSQIKSIFKQIKLNVDNSNTFFVQQGKVTEIVKFHPLELMKFVEESAGVSYFNSVKQETIRNMENNEPKLNSCIEGVQKLQKEQEGRQQEIEVFKKYQNIKQQLTKLLNKKEHYERKQGKEDIIRNQKETERLFQEQDQLKQQISQCEDQLQQKQEEYQEFCKNQKNQVQKSQDNQLSSLKQNLDNIINKIKETKIDQENLLNKKQKDEEQNQKNLQEKQEKEILLKSLYQQIQNYKLDKQKNTLEFKELQNHVQQNNSKNKQTSFLKQKQQQSKQEYLNIQNKLKDEQERKKNLEENLKQLEEKMAYKNSEYETYIKSLEKFIEIRKDYDIEQDIIRKEKQKFQEIQKQKDLSIKYEQEIDDEMHSELKNLLKSFDIEGLQRIQRQFNKNVFFKKVHNIIRVKDPERFNTALETIAGRKLFQYVVRDQNVATELMESNLLKDDNIQIIPNNKITGSRINIQKVTQAKTIASQMKECVWTPQELIEYPSDLENTINYVFQNVMICSNSRIAKKICFDQKDLSLPCITLDGDTYDPSGQLSGGFKSNRISYLELSQIYKGLIKKKQNNWAQREKILRQEEQLKNVFEKDKKLKEKIFLNTQKQNDYQQKVDQLKLENLRNQISSIHAEINFSEKSLQDLQQKSDKIRQLKNQYSQQIQRGQSISKQEFFIQRLQNLQEQLQTLDQDIEQYEKKIKETEIYLSSFSSKNKNDAQSQKQTDDQIQVKRAQLENLKQQKKELKQKLDEHQQQQFMQQNHLNFINKKDSELKKQIEKSEEIVEQYKNQLIQCKQDIEQKIQQQKLLEELFQQNKKRRGQRYNIEFEEEENDEEESREMIAQILLQTKQTISKLNQELQELKKVVNQDIEEAYNKGYKKLQTFIEQKDETIRNKQNLHSSIQILTQKSYEAVHRCFEKVNENLGKIFSIFLPGMFAQMEMIEVQNKKKTKSEKGIQIKVKIGNKWKASLSELSGGQRTLLALSFLLSLLKYNSAPFYIFDEVDAALDQSNTENLGYIISKYFSEKLPQSTAIPQWRELI